MQERHPWYRLVQLSEDSDIWEHDPLLREGRGYLVGELRLLRRPGDIDIHVKAWEVVCRRLLLSGLLLLLLLLRRKRCVVVLRSLLLLCLSRRTLLARVVLCTSICVGACDEDGSAEDVPGLLHGCYTAVWSPGSTGFGEYRWIRKTEWAAETRAHVRLKP